MREKKTEYSIASETENKLQNTSMDPNIVF